MEKRDILTVEDLAIHFGGVHALDGVNLAARTAEIAGVIGPNGAGKTTFFNCLSGLLTPDRGEITFDGHRLNGSPATRGRHGLGRTFQTPKLFGTPVGARQPELRVPHGRLRPPGVRVRPGPAPAVPR